MKDVKYMYQNQPRNCSDAAILFKIIITCTIALTGRLKKFSCKKVIAVGGPELLGFSFYEIAHFQSNSAT